MRERADKDMGFEIIFKENYSRLYYHALSFLNDEESARDAVNDAFEILWSRYEQLEFSTPVTPLLYTLVRNSCINHLRRLKAQERFSSEVLWTTDEAEEEYDARDEELMERLRDSIERLPEQMKVVFKKCFLDGRKYQEAADELDISVNTVKTHVRKALRMLRGEFSAEQLILYVSLYKSSM